ncbi:MAG: bifunctional (p)ppGpp synthetase/guanosine-3',5'-bis(diphosphate) 3'-pyrophosphohydrolase [Deltaproteobacteria bacterium]|nr:bifunctional (p)ppGpp synthetase/guanosine-3',5'-bis(diphosphate) 3'-pyrophosphohydrolase [Deltaproteobacteria bacterium]
MIRFTDIADAVSAYHPNPDLELIRRAYVYAAKVHQGQVRLSGEPYLAHPLEVANILTKMHLDVSALAAGFLHDTVEDTPATLSEIKELFGQEVAKIVEGVTKISAMEFTSRTVAQAENIRKMILSMASDIRVLLVKLADRLHNMRTLGFQKPDKQTLVAQETLDIYAPLAGRLGIHWIKSELEDLCFFVLEPEAYRRIADRVAQRVDLRTAYIKQVKDVLRSRLTEHEIKARVEGRTKHYYSIHRKMAAQHLGVDQLFDIYGFRVIVDKISACYEALGVVHSLWKPIPGRFKDYINLPKANRYQSLHTSVIGPEGIRIEIQIRTEDMHQVAEHGIAAHWRYKEGGEAMEKAEWERFAWLRQLLEWQRELSDPREFLDSVKIELYQEEVYVFTPAGEVKVMPKGATPVDFAYAIHSEVGHHCSGAKVDGRIVPLRQVLLNGQVVEILTDKNRQPSKDWLSFVVTSKAKQKIRSWIKAEERARSEAMGQEMLDKELRRLGSNFKSALKKGDLDQAADTFSLQTAPDLIAAVGYGKLTAKQVVHKILPSEEEGPEGAPPGFLDRMVRKVRRKHKEGIRVKGMDDILVRFAKCCNPLPGDEVIGFITHGRGVSVHRVECANVVAADPNRLIEVEWVAGEELGRPIRLNVISNDKAGTLAQVTSVFSSHEVNISEAHIQPIDHGQSRIALTILVKDRKQLDTLIGDLKKLKEVRRVTRMSH